MIYRCSFIIALIFVSATSLAAVSEPVSKFVATQCLDCHDHETHKGNLDLQGLPRDLSDPVTFKRWEKIHDRVLAGEMPPKAKKARPSAADVKSAMDSLTANLTEADLARRGDEGRAKLRRLTRTEIEYTMRDVFALPGLPVKADLPEDGTAAGFDKVSEALDISNVQMAHYLDMVHFVLDRAIATRPEPPIPFKQRLYPAHEFPFNLGLSSGECVLLKDKQPDPAMPMLRERIGYAELMKNLGPTTSAIGDFRSVDESWNLGFATFNPVLPGRYKLRLSIWSFYWDKGKVLPSKTTQVVAVSNQTGEVIHLDAPSLGSKVHEFEMWLEPNDRISLDLASLQHVTVYNRKGLAPEYQGPAIAFDWLEVEGPIYDAWPPQSHQRIFGSLPLTKMPKDAKGKLSANAPARWAPPKDHRPSRWPRGLAAHGTVDGLWTTQPENPKQEAERLLRPLLTRLFRRPVTDAQFARYMGLVSDRLAVGDCLEDAMRMAITGALCSPEFLYRMEKPGRLDDWAIASRLSYLLWDSVPDDELIALAAQGKLHASNDIIRAQVRRMLADPRSQRFINDFLNQWLALKEIASTTPDNFLYPEFAPYMQRCMVNETRAFFRELIDQNLGVRNLVSSEFAMLNAELCKIYGLSLGLEGDALKKVPLPPGSHRGGIITQGAILKITANGTTTSPVKRGAWIMDRLLGKPPEPPPPTISAIEPDLRGTVTIRQQLDVHRHEAICAGCHRVIDPPGFALESYDVIGRWRERYRTKEQGELVKDMVGEGHYPVRYHVGLPVDSAGETANGEPFHNIDEFRGILLKDQRQLARNFVRRLAIYATGRDITFADRPAIEAILDQCEVRDNGDVARFGNYRVRSMIEELAVSELFLTK